MQKSKCSRTDFTRTQINQLDSKAIAVQKGLAEHTTPFPAPPVSPSAMGTLISNYNTALSAYKRGGMDQKPAFTAAQTSLKNALAANADYVDAVADGSETLIIKAGYVPTKITDTIRPAPAKPKRVVAKHGKAIGEMLAECPSVSHAVQYGLVLTKNSPLTNAIFVNGQLVLDGHTNIVLIDVNKARKKRLQNLSPGSMYYIYMWAGNANGTSALTEVVQLMAA